MPLANIAGVGVPKRDASPNRLPFYTGETGFDDQGVETRTSAEQLEVEDLVLRVVNQLLEQTRDNPGYRNSLPVLVRRSHVKFILKAINNGLHQSYQNLDASGPWLCYWTVHSMNLLGIELEDSMKSAFVRYLNRCKHPLGGYNGGPQQVAHLAATYGAVTCLLSLGTTEAYESIDRKSLLSFLLRMHQPDGSFIMHDAGEVDVRGTYCALAVARLTNIMCEPLTRNCVEFILACQTYEGGFGGLPGLEAHGGYTFCSIAALAILDSESKCNLQKLLKWLVMRQCPFEGGFNGRTNKLVDSCYSYWQAGAIPIVYRALSLDERFVETLPVNRWLFNQRALQEYLLTCCQSPHGGLIDKPGKHPDYYHTCYALSGLSISQHFTFPEENAPLLVGSNENQVEVTDPVHNMRTDCVVGALAYFSRLPVPKLQQY